MSLPGQLIVNDDDSMELSFMDFFDIFSINF